MIDRKSNDIKMNIWSKLPNAKHIDWVLESLKSNTDIWIEACNQAYDQAWFQAYNQDYSTVYNQAFDEVWNKGRIQTYDQTIDQVWIKASNQVWVESWNQTSNHITGVLLALVAHDDCDQYLCMSYSELKTWILVSEKSPAILLLPMVYVKEQTNECLV